MEIPDSLKGLPLSKGLSEDKEIASGRKDMVYTSTYTNWDGMDLGYGMGSWGVNPISFNEYRFGIFVGQSHGVGYLWVIPSHCGV